MNPVHTPTSCFCKIYLLEVGTLNSQRKLNFDSHHTSSHETLSTYPLTKHELYFNISMKLHMSLSVDVTASCTSIVLGLGSVPLPACSHNLVYDSSKSNNRRYPSLILLSFPIRSDFCTAALLLLQFSTKEKVHSAFFPVFTMYVCVYYVKVKIKQFLYRPITCP